MLFRACVFVNTFCLIFLSFAGMPPRAASAPPGAGGPDAPPPRTGRPPRGGARSHDNIPKGHWCATLNNPTVDELKSLWLFNEPHGPVPDPPHKLGYIIIGDSSWVVV